jgi:hypothetical protein
MAASQVPWGVETLAGAVTNPAWRVKPTYYLIATEDRMIRYGLSTWRLVVPDQP